MSSVSSTSSSTSIYGTRTVISGLASGMDTESMIENAVSGYQTKIATLQQKVTKKEWEQTAIRSMISKMVSFSNKYSSYTSSTNLMSSSFFNNAVKVSTLGASKDKVSATGKTSSTVELMGVQQLATSASYTVSGGALASSSDKPTISGGDLKLNETFLDTKLSGSITFGYGNMSVSVDIDGIVDDSTDVIQNGKELVDEINAQLEEQTITINGNGYKASDKIKVSWDDTNKKIVVANDPNDKAGNSVGILSATGDLKTTLGIESKSASTLTEQKEISLSDKKLYTDDTTYAKKLAETGISFTFDGTTKKITLDGINENSTMADVQTALQKELNKAFGDNKVTVNLTSDADDEKKGSLSFEIGYGSTLEISNGTALKLDSDSETTYANTSKKLGDLLTGFSWTNTATMIEAKGSVTQVAATKDTEAYYKDEDGNRVAKFVVDGTEKWYRVDEDGNWLHSLEINGESVGAFSKETTLETVMTKINGNADVNVSLSYSKITNEFRFTSSDSGSASKVEITGGLAAALFGKTVDENGEAVNGYEAGQDALVKVKVNGKEMDLSRSSNSFDIDGLTINVKGTFNYDKIEKTLGNGEVCYEAAQTLKDGEGNELETYLDEEGYYCDNDGKRYKDANDKEVLGTFATSYAKGSEAVTFESAADADTIVDAVKSMIEDYNAMVTEIKEAYSTLPLQTSSGAYYEPLTDDDKADMSDAEIERYEEKAKTGLLFGDNDLSSLYNRLTQAVQSVGTDLKSIGIEVSYDSGLTTLTLTESKLRSALEADPDKVRDVFTKSTENGASSNGLMAALKTPLDMYAKTTGASKGILIERAGSTLSPTSIYQNTIQTELDNLNTQIETWQDRLSDKVDYYTSKFTKLEQLISEMNSQSSTLSSLMGG